MSDARENALVSIIVPVYNVQEKMLFNCIDSILLQTYRNFEIILVDDGSTDNSGALCGVLMQKDERIKVIHQANQGVSVARNNGTRCALGEYIMYVDADDLLAPYVLEDSIEVAKRSGADVVIGAIVRIYESNEFSTLIGESVTEYDVYASDNLDGLRQHFVVGQLGEFSGINKNGYIGRGPWARLVNAKIAKKCCFPTDLPLGEDLLWNMRILNCCNKVAIVRSIWYGYLIYGTSAIRRYRGDREQKVKAYLNLLWEENEAFCKQYRDTYVINLAIEFYCILNYELLSPKCALHNREKRKTVRQYLKTDPWSMLTVRSVRKKLPLMHRLILWLCPSGLWIEVLRLYNIVKKRKNN